MPLFLLFALLISLILVWLWMRAARSGPVLSESEKERRVVARHLSQIEARLADGQIEADMAREAQLAAVRSLKGAGNLSELKPHPISSSMGLSVIGAVLVVGMGLYVWQGRPFLSDQPYRARIKAWETAAATQPESLSYGEMAVVMRQYEQRLGNQPDYWSHRGEADLKAANYADAVRDFSRLTRLLPESARAWTQLGVALVGAGEGRASPAANRAFDKALALDPDDIGARFFRARAEAEAGHFSRAEAMYQDLIGRLPPHDARREVVADQIERLKAPAEAARGNAEMIHAMVNRLEGELKHSPDNPQGWARLLRSWKVLGDQARYEAARSAMTRTYNGRPDVVARIVSEAEGPVQGPDGNGG